MASLVQAFTGHLVQVVFLRVYVLHGVIENFCDVYVLLRRWMFRYTMHLTDVHVTVP